MPKPKETPGLFKGKPEDYGKVVEKVDRERDKQRVKDKKK